MRYNLLQWHLLLDFLFRDDVHEEIEYFCVVDAGGDVTFLVVNICGTWRVRLFPSSVNCQALCVSSMMKISQALAKRTGASAEII
jgi:hypothetical protein